MAPSPHSRRRRLPFAAALIGAALWTGPASAQGEPEPAATEVAVSGYVQAVGVVHDQTSEDELDPATGDPLNATRFLIRRARLRGQARHRWVSGRLELDGNTTEGLTAVVQSAFVAVGWPQDPPSDAWPLVEARVGLFHTPFGRDVQQSSSGRPFLERSNAARALFANSYDQGAELRGQWRFLRYQVALLDGAPPGAADFPAQDPSAVKDVAGRLGVHLSILQGLRVDAGASLLFGRGFSPGTPGTKDDVRWVDANENGIVELSELMPVAGTAARASQTFARSALGADLELQADLPYVGTLGAFGEVYRALNLDRAMFVADPVTLGRDLRELGLAVGVSQELFGHGLIALRYDLYDPDVDASERIAAELVPRDRSVSTFAVTLAYVGLEPLFVGLEYDHEDNNQGRADDGSPTRLAADRLLLRAQVDL